MCRQHMHKNTLLIHILRLRICVSAKSSLMIFSGHAGAEERARAEEAKTASGSETVFQ